MLREGDRGLLSAGTRLGLWTQVTLRCHCATVPCQNLGHRERCSPGLRIVRGCWKPWMLADCLQRAQRQDAAVARWSRILKVVQRLVRRV